MGLKINSEKLFEVMKAFYDLSGIRMIIFDKNGDKVLAYPENDCSFCRMMKAEEKTSSKCAECDMRSFEECKKSGKLKLYTCYAGLVEGCCPLKKQDKVIGYVMFGQISDLPSRTALKQNIKNVCEAQGLESGAFLSKARNIKLKTYDEIMSAAKIFEACVSYIILNDMLFGSEDRLIADSEKFIDENISFVTVESLARHLGISRTALYTEFSGKCCEGVSSFIKRKRFERAKSLLESSSMSIISICRECGFDDYNYFSRVFKSRYGTSPSDYRRKSRNKEARKDV